MGQAAWTDKIQQILENPNLRTTPMVKRILKFISSYPNIPRKRPKFLNFIKNTCKWADAKSVEACWDLFEAVKTQDRNQTKITEQNELKSKIDSNTSNGESKKRQLKIKADIESK